MLSLERSSTSFSIIIDGMPSECMVQLTEPGKAWVVVVWDWVDFLYLYVD